MRSCQRLRLDCSMTQLFFRAVLRFDVTRCLLVGNRSAPAIMYVVEPATFQLSNIVKDHACTIYAELLALHILRARATL
jgi:hypothetical protein